MKSRVIALASLFTLSAFGIYQGYETPKTGRAPASISVSYLMADDQQSFKEEIERKLNDLHAYYVMAEKSLIDFDQTGSKDIYQSKTYLKLLAVRNQTQELEEEISAVWTDESAKPAVVQRKLLLKNLVTEFAKLSSIKAASLTNLYQKMSLKSPSTVIPTATVTKELTLIKRYQDYRVLETNIEHLAHMMDGRKVKNQAETLEWLPQPSGLKSLRKIVKLSKSASVQRNSRALL